MKVANKIPQVRENKDETRSGALYDTANDDRDHNMRKTDSVRNQLVNIIEEVSRFGQNNVNVTEVNYVL